MSTATAARESRQSAEEAGIRWVPSHNTERMLEFFHAGFDPVEDFELRKIDFKASLNNEARFGNALDLERVAMLERQSQLMLIELPYIILWPNPDAQNRPMILDGNHRAQLASRRGDPTIGAYLLKGVGSEHAETIKRVANSFVGMGSTPEEALQHAVAFAIARESGPDAMSVREVASLFPGVSETTLNHHVQVARYRRRFDPAGGDLPAPNHGRVPDAAIRELLKLKQNETVLRAAVSAVAALPKPDRAAAEALVVAVNGVRPRDQDLQLAKIKEEAARLAGRVEALASTTTGHGGRRTVTRAKRLMAEFSRFKTAVNGVVGTRNVVDVLDTEKVRAEAAAEIREIKQILNRFTNELKEAQ